MRVVPPDEFERLVGSLEAAAFASFIADLWAARGWRTTLEDAIVVARDTATGREERLVVVPKRGWTRQRSLPATEADVLVHASDPSALPPAVADLDARRMGPDDLRALLLYGIDREVADRLFVAHFDRPLAVEPPAPSRLSSFGSRRDRLILIVGFLLGAAVVGTIGGVAVFGPSDSPGEAALGVTPVPNASATPNAGQPDPDYDYPPGVSPSGVNDVEALASAHGAAIVNRSYNLLLIHRGSVDLLAPERTWVSSRQTVDRENATRFWYRVTGIALEDDGNRSVVVYDDYADNQHTYRRIATTRMPTFKRGVIPTAGGDGAFTAVGTAYVGRFLATTDSRVSVFNASDQRRFRIVATGKPHRLPWPVADYTAVAWADETGLVYRLTVEYTRLDRARGEATEPGTTGTALADGTVRFELVYRDFGEPTGMPPSWYGTARNTTNETVDDLRSPESIWWSQPIGVDYREEE